MTDPVYLKDSYRKEFESTVTKVDGKDIVLDKTIFYPTSGGQPGDIGAIVVDGKEYRILATKKAGQDIIHEVDSEGIRIGDQATALIDWSRRYMLMRYHTACHILSTVVEKDTGSLITGNQIAEDKSRIDFNMENFDRDKIQEYEKKTNDMIAENLDVETRFLPKDEAFQIPGISKLKNVLPPSVENIRIVGIGNIDIQACGGTHVRNTEEIGPIEIIKIDNKGKNNRRIYFRLKD